LCQDSFSWRHKMPPHKAARQFCARLKRDTNLDTNQGGRKTIYIAAQGITME
jgi:hypothetical protein